MTIQFFEDPLPVRRAVVCGLACVAAFAVFAVGKYTGLLEIPAWKLLLGVALAWGPGAVALARRFLPVVSIDRETVRLPDSLWSNKSIRIDEIQDVTLRDGMLTIELKAAKSMKFSINDLAAEKQREVRELLLVMIGSTTNEVCGARVTLPRMDTNAHELSQQPTPSLS